MLCPVDIRLCAVDMIPDIWAPLACSLDPYPELYPLDPKEDNDMELWVASSG